MERRTFLSKASSKAVAIVGLSAGVFALEEYGPEMELPGLRGTLRVRKMVRRSLISNAQAQYYGYNYSMAPYQQWMAAQQAQIDYIRFLQQQQAQLAWLRQQHWMAMQALMQQYSQHQIGRPQPWEGARAVYAYAQRGSETLFVGGTANGDQVRIKDAVPAAETVFGRTRGRYSLMDLQGGIGPQSNERRVKIAMPDGSREWGKAYDTRKSTFSVTDSAQFTDQQGRSGKVAKFEIGPDGEKYEVV